MSPTEKTSFKPPANPKKLQKQTIQSCVPVTTDNNHSHPLPSPKTPSSPASKLLQPSVTAASRDTKTSHFKTHIPLSNPAFTKDANKPRAISRPQKSKSEAARATSNPRVPTLRNVSNADSGVVLSPLSSPPQTSPKGQRTESTADSAIDASSPTAAAVGTKHVEKTGTPLLTLATGQQQKRQLPRPVGKSKDSSNGSNTMANSHRPSYTGSRAGVEAHMARFRDSPYHAPLRESTYPTPLADSPLTGTALDLRKSAHGASISTDSSSSSLRRLLSRASLKPGVSQRPTKTPTLPRGSSTLDEHRTRPYEAISDAGDPPVHVASPVTPTVVSYATTPVEALPGVRDSVSKRSKDKGSKHGGSLWFLFRQRAKSGWGAKRTNGFQRSSTDDDDHNHSLCSAGNGFDRTNGVGQHTSPRPPQVTGSSFHTSGAQTMRPTSPHAERQLPPFPGVFTKPTLSRAPPNTRRQSGESLNETPAADEEIEIQRNRRRALFALDGVTYPGADRSPPLPLTPTRAVVQQHSQRRPPPPPPPRPPKPAPPQICQSFVSSTTDTTATSSREHSRMSEAVQQHFVRRGKEAEARVFAHARALEEAEAQRTSSSASGLDMDYPAPEKIQGGSEAPIVSSHRADVAWWEVGNGDVRPKSSMTAKSDKKAILDQAMVELETAASAAAVKDDGEAGNSEKSSTSPLPQQVRTAGALPTRASQPYPTQQRQEEQKSYLRGRQLTRATFRRYREAGLWDNARTEQTHGSDSLSRASNVSPIQDQRPVKVHVPRKHAESATLDNDPASNGSSSTGSSSASLRSTALRNGKPRPFLNVYEAAHAVHHNPLRTLSQQSLGLSAEQKRSMRPQPLSWRSEQQSGEINGEPEGRSVVLPSGVDGQGGQPDAGTNASAARTYRRPPPPPPPQTPKSAVPDAVTSSTESVTQGEAKAKRHPPPPPPIPPKSSLRPRLGGDWSDVRLQGLKQGILQSSDLCTVVEEAAWATSACSRSSGWTDVKAQRGGDSDGVDERESESEHFWSEDEGDGKGRSKADTSSKDTTPEKMAAWQLLQDDKGSRDDEMQVLEYYLDTQREEEERDRRVADEDAKKAAAAAAEAEEARKREDEARRQRVANLMARVRAGTMK